MTIRKIPIDEAQTAARKQAISAEHILASLEKLAFVDAELRGAIEARQAELLPALRRISTTERGLRKLNASALLVELGEIRGTAGIVDCVVSADGGLCQSALRRLMAFRWNRDKGGYQVPLDKDALFLATEPLLRSFDTKVRIAAARVLERLDTQAARTRLTELLKHDDPDLRLEVATWLASRGEDHGALEVIEARLAVAPKASNDIYKLVTALEHLGARGDPVIKARVASIAMSFARPRLQLADNNTANEVWRCLKAISAAAPPDEGAFLSEVLGSRLLCWVRGVALLRLAELEGERGIERLCAALRDEISRKTAAEGLAKFARGTRNARAVEVLTETLATESDGSTRAALVQALIAVSDGKDLEQLSDQLQKLDPFVAMNAHWMMNNIGPTQVTERLSLAGIVPAAPAEQLAKYEAGWTKIRSAYSVLLDVLGTAEKLWVIDCKSSFEADHGKFISELASLCQGIVSITYASQVREPSAEDQHLVRFVAGGQAFSFWVKDHGRYYDVPTVLDALNTAFESLGLRERFIQFRATDTFAFGVFVRPEAFLPIVQDLQIPLEPLRSI